MGLTQVEECVFTGLPVKNIVDADMRDAIEYWLDLGTHKIIFRLSHEALKWNVDNDFFQQNKYLFQGLIFNNDWFENQKDIITIDKLKELLTQKTYPKTPQEKADTLFEYYLSMQKEDGETVRPDYKYSITYAWKKLYFKSYDELLYYTKYLDSQDLISAVYTTSRKSDDGLFSFNITVDGLNYGIKIHSEGEKSNLCFIAMSFDKRTTYIRNAIKEALWETGFRDILIDEQNIDSDKTINDEIIASLKKCKFCIADFSYHSNGVYFESGFALGQNKKVIYTCLESEFKNAHFDIRPLQHIIYPTAEELKLKLKYKIEAWIK